MIINILSPLIGRHFTAYDYFEQIKRIIALNPEITFNWIVNDASNGKVFKRMIDDTGIPCTYLKFKGDVRGYEYTDKSDKLSMIVADTNNKMVKEMPPCDYVLLIEDDIICKTENPIPYLLNGFTEGIGAVSGCVFNKRLTKAFGAIQAMTEDGHIEWQDSGYTKVIGTSFGFIMFRNELLGDKPFKHNYKNSNKSVDISYGLKLKDLGLGINYCWDIKIWHYFKTKDGIVGKADETTRKPQHKIKMVRRQLDCKNTIFVNVPETMTEKEIKALYKFGVKKESIV